MAAPYVEHSTYASFKAATLGNRYDMDGFPSEQPYQCYDYVDLLYEQSDVGQYLSTGGTGNVKGCWEVASARASNGSGHFEIVTDKTAIKKGDIIVFDTYGDWYGSTGHIGFADEDYNGTNFLNCLGQHQGGAGQTDPSNITNLNLNGFLGVFRNTNWQQAPELPWPVAWKHWRNFKRR